MTTRLCNIQTGKLPLSIPDNMDAEHPTSEAVVTVITELCERLQAAERKIVALEQRQERGPIKEGL